MSAIVFFNIGWMNAYRGFARGDTIRGGGAWVDKYGVGHEAYNFAAYRGRYYGFVQPPHGGDIHIERLGAGASDDYIDNVTIAWVAKHPTEGLQLVGWYSKARLYRRSQEPPAGAHRPVRSERDQAWHFAVATVAHSTVLEPDERTLSIPRNRRGEMGQSNVWYADSPQGRSTIAKVRDLIHVHGGSVQPQEIRRSKGHRSIDPARKVQIEQASVNAVRHYYEHLGFQVRDVQRDNVGWDLEAAREGERLLIEVKGLSGTHVAAELTPNEHRQMQKHRKQFRLCIVSSALDSDHLKIRRFAFLRNRQSWVDQNDCALQIEERIAARVQLAGVAD